MRIDFCLLCKIDEHISHYNHYSTCIIVLDIITNTHKQHMNVLTMTINNGTIQLSRHVHWTCQLQRDTKYVNYRRCMNTSAAFNTGRHAMLTTKEKRKERWKKEESMHTSPWFTDCVGPISMLPCIQTQWQIDNSLYKALLGKYTSPIVN